MSFENDLIAKCGEYTSFAIHSIQIPYLNGAKNTPAQILNAINAWRGTSQKSTAEIQTWVNNNPSKTGVDCSGLAYYVLNEASGGSVRAYFEGKSGRSLPYGYGISAANLTSPSCGQKKTKAGDMTPGCLMRSDNGGHVLVIHTVSKDFSGKVSRIYYTHSNGGYGPHPGKIIIGDENQDLNGSAQTWSDAAYTNAAAKSLYTYTMLLECL